MSISILSSAVLLEGVGLAELLVELALDLRSWLLEGQRFRCHVYDLFPVLAKVARRCSSSAWPERSAASPSSANAQSGWEVYPVVHLWIPVEEQMLDRARKREFWSS